MAVAERTPERLPRGRHHLSRDEVTQSQRSRMLLAMADAMTQKGYVGTSVADVLKGAGVSRETFYQQFSSKLDCFMSAFDVAGDQSRDDAGGTPLERFDRAFGAYLDTLAEQPALARVFLVEVYAAGPDALARRFDIQSRIVDGMAALLGARTKQDRFACQVLAAAVGSMVTGPLVAGDMDALRGLRGDIVNLVKRALDARTGGR